MGEMPGDEGGRVMNEYGRKAMAWWEQLAPSTFAGLDDPVAFFTRVGVEAAEQVELLVDHWAPDVPGESEEERDSRRWSAQLRAEEVVIAEMLVPPPQLREDREPEPEIDWYAEEEARRDEMERWHEDWHRRQEVWERWRETAEKLEARGWSMERIREVGARIDLSEPGAMAVLEREGLL